MRRAVPGGTFQQLLYKMKRLLFAVVEPMARRRSSTQH